MSTWSRTDFLDEYAEGGEGVVLLPDGRVVALAATAWSVVEALTRRPLDELEVARDLVAKFGTPRDEEGNDLSKELTAATLDELATGGIVVRLGAESPDHG